MKALVIGAPGQVGRALMHLLPDAGMETIGTYHSRPQPHMVPLDVGDVTAVRATILEHQPTAIFLTAALTAVDYSENHQDEAWNINVQGPRAVAEAAAEVGAKVVYYSTEYVFDGEDGPYSEEDPISPQGVYARSKAEGEKVVRAATDNCLIVRTTVVFGWDPTSKNFAMQLWERLSAGERMRVPSDQISNPTLVDFLALASVVMVQDDVRGIVNVVGRDRVSRSEFAIRLARGLGLDPDLIDPISTSELNQVAPRPLNAGLRTDKLEGLLGRPAIGLDEAIDSFAYRCKAATASPSTGSG